ncbi:MAG: hypothetical protein JSV05_02685 [Candidatus Bathyarchaeota archaeon]|nr:MAG: hypothetical protein JSV05_02685 [Candidatus Bathyarchaeota archaeon]
MTVSTVAEKKMEERIEKRKLEVQKIALDLEAAKSVVEKDKRKFFAKLGFLKPSQEEIECESAQLFYEPFTVAKANYYLDYYKKKTYSIKVDDEVSEVIIFGQTLKPELVRGLLRRPHKTLAFDVQERVIHRVVNQVALNRRGHEVDPTKLPSGPIEPDSKKALEKAGEKVRKLTLSPETILDLIRKRTAQRPPDVGKIAKEVFEITEHTVILTPIYEARCRQVKTGEIRIIPISGITGKMLSL